MRSDTSALLTLALACTLSACDTPPSGVMIFDSGPADAYTAPPLDGGADAAPSPPPSVSVRDTGALHSGRISHTTTLLPSGRVIVIGGETLARERLSDVEEYDPATGEWTVVATMTTPRANHSATLLPDGRVLVVGGGANSDNGLPTGESVVGTALLYDPVAHTFTEGAPLSRARGHHAAIALPDGSVLVVGGAARSDGDFTAVAEAERYTPDSDRWEAAGSLAVARAMVRVELDSEDRPVVIGGLSVGLAGFSVVAEVERWEAGAFSSVGTLPRGGRIYHATLRGDDGEILVAGGLAAGIFLTGVERLAPGASRFESLAELPSPRNSVALASTSSGVLAIGGFVYAGSSTLFEDILLLESGATELAASGLLPTGRAGHHAVTLPSGEVLVVGGFGVFSELPTAMLLTVGQ